jgi:hypothetical protein
MEIAQQIHLHRIVSNSDEDEGQIPLVSKIPTFADYLLDQYKIRLADNQQVP